MTIVIPRTSSTGFAVVSTRVGKGMNKNAYFKGNPNYGVDVVHCQLIGRLSNIADHKQRFNGRGTFQVGTRGWQCAVRTVPSRTPESTSAGSTHDRFVTIWEPAGWQVYAHIVAEEAEPQLQVYNIWILLEWKGEKCWHRACRSVIARIPCKISYYSW